VVLQPKKKKASMSKRHSDVELDQKGGMVVTGLAMMVFHFLARPLVKGPLIAAVVMLVVWKLLTADG
jgi:hypothetical protein